MHQDAGVRRVLAVALVVLLLVLAGLLLDPVSAATTTDPEQDGCGSLPQVVTTRSGYHGGEMRPDAERFDAACVAAADRRLRLALPVTAVATGLGGYLLLTRRRRPGIRGRSNAAR